MRLLCFVAISLSVGAFIAFADDKKPDDAAQRAEKLAALKKKFDREFADLSKRARETDDPNTRRGLALEAKELAVLSAQNAMGIVENDPKDAVGFEAALFVVQETGRFGGGKEFDAAAAIIAEHHINNAKIKDILPRMAYSGPGGEKFLSTASEKSTDKQVKGLALYYLGTQAADQLDDEEDEKRIDELVAKATGLFDKAVKEAPDARVSEGDTIAKEVKAQLDGFAAIKNLAIGKPVPEIVGTDLSGKPVKLSDYKGKVVLVDIWATWCGPCRAMIPHEREMVMNLKDKPFALLSVSCDKDQETLVKFFEKEQMPWDHWFDGPRGSVAKSFRVRAFPTLYLIDHSGIIRQKWIGSPGNDKLDKAVDELVKTALKAKG